MLFIICSFLSINLIISTSTKNSSENESLRQVLEFINQKSGQTSPVFDISVKPYYDHVHAAIERVIQKAIDDKYLNPHDNSTAEIELTAHQQQNILEQLYKNNPSLFLSLEELKKETKSSVSAPVKREEQPSTNDFTEPSVYASQPTSEYDYSSYNDSWDQGIFDEMPSEDSYSSNEITNDYPYQEAELDNSSNEYYGFES